MSAFGSEADMQGRVAALVSTLVTRGGHFKSVDQTAGAMRTRVPQSEVKSAGARGNRSDRNGVYGKGTP